MAFHCAFSTFGGAPDWGPPHQKKIFSGRVARGPLARGKEGDRTFEEARLDGGRAAAGRIKRGDKPIPQKHKEEGGGGGGEDRLMYPPPG